MTPIESSDHDPISQLSRIETRFERVQNSSRWDGVVRDLLGAAYAYVCTYQTKVTDTHAKVSAG